MSATWIVHVVRICPIPGSFPGTELLGGASGPSNGYIEDDR